VADDLFDIRGKTALVTGGSIALDGGCRAAL
jgi:hypothetical protein